jgi:DNA-directed RNA polymerase subunit beta
MRKTLVSDKIETKEEALMDIYRRLRPGNPATIEVAQDFIDHLFFRQAYYDLSKVGRLKMNHRLNVNTKIDVKDPAERGCSSDSLHIDRAQGHPGPGG